jgi:vitamin B12 transporter
MHKILSLALACLLLSASQSWSATLQTLEPVVVTATKLETPAREVASSVTVITAAEIEEKQQTSVAEVLRAVPGVDIVRSGGPGEQTSIFLRGANSSQTLVLIDGIEANDPIDPNRAFNFAFLDTNNIERVEIVRGPQSTLYGSDAMGGVVNIITKRGKGKPQVQATAEGGSYETHQESIGISGGNNLINYSLSASYLDTDGISAASEENGNSERDGYERITASSRIGLTPTDNFDLDFILRYIDSETDLDDAWGIPQDDPNHFLTQKTLFLRTEARLSLFENFWEQKLGFSLTDYDRDDIDKADPSNPFDIDFEMFFKSRLYKIDWQNNLLLHETNTLTFGVEYEEEKAETTYFDEEKANTKGYYLQDQIRLWDAFFTTLGVRIDDHDQFGTHATYRIASAYFFEKTNTKIRASYGTGFKSPSLDQLYGFAGDPDLDPEKSKGWDAGIDQGFFGNKISLSATYFENDFEDLITWDPINSILIQTDEAKTKGVELSTMFKPLDSLTIDFNYTYTDTEDKETGDQLLRRPRNKFGANINYIFLDRGNIGLGVIYVGEREDTVSGSRVELADYTVLNATASYQITKMIRIHGRIDNLLDEDYEEVSGYGTPGISGYVGAKVIF